MEGTILETDMDLTQKLLNTRMVMKQISQLSYELKEIDKIYGQEYYESNRAEQLLKLYTGVEDKVISLARDLKKSRE